MQPPTKTIEPKALVDVAIQVYGKPYQTAVTLESLARHSRPWINRIFFVEERRQPEPFDFSPLIESMPVPVVRFRPRYWHGDNVFRPPWKLRFTAYRQALRYQYAWETTDQPYLFLTHNDMLYEKDLIGAYLGQIGDAIGIGAVGQCWNCEAHYAGKCVPERQREYRPSPSEFAQLLASTRPGPRRSLYPVLAPGKPAWPLPECRLNEFAALINMRLARGISFPAGPVLPFGATVGVDVGSQWFSQVCQMGFSVHHFDFSAYAKHAWATPGAGGFEAQLDPSLYRSAEERAKALLEQDYGFPVRHL